jgi:hypothetical protein
MNSDRILKAFGNHVGVKNMVFDYQRTCSLVVDKKDVIIINDIEERSIMISCILGRLDKESLSDSKIVMELLSVNMMFAADNGPYVGYEPRENSVVLSVANLQEEMTPLMVSSQITYLLKNKRHVKKKLAERDIVFLE